ncbi:MAG TPA: hypothetical protein VHE35_33215 [Kofleriaceae bacterium]|nr:hypothetical protein [Kofleriaceae bacterium]
MRLAPILLALVPACGDDAASPPDAAPGTTVTLTLQDGAGTTSNADLVAFQDGDGPWTVLTGDQGHYQASVITGRYGFVVACSSGLGDGDTRLYLSTTDESTAVTDFACTSTPLPLTISGTVTHSDSVFVDVSSLHDVDFLADESTYSLGTRPGPDQLLVVDHDQNLDPGRIVRRDLGPIAGDRMEDVDLADGLLGTVVAPTVSGFSVEDTHVFGGALLYTGGGVLLLPTVDSDLGGDAPPAYLLLAPSQRLADDRVDATLFADRGDFRDTGPYASRSVGVRDVTPTSTFALPDLREFPAPTVSGSSLSWSLPAQTLAADERLVVDASAYSSSTVRDIFADISPGWVAEPRTVRLGGLEQLPGWKAAWSLAGDTDWSVSVDRSWADGYTSSGSRGIVAVGTTAAAPASLRAQAYARHRARLRALERVRDRTR